MSTHSSTPRYLKHASGQARVILNGKTFYLGKYGSKASKQRYDALIAEWLSSGRSSTFGLTPSEASMAQVMLDYIGPKAQETLSTDWRELPINRCSRPQNRKSTAGLP